MDRRCKQCLIRDIDPDEYLSKIKMLLDHMDKKEKASDSEYENRLGICQACDDLLEGTCFACGCYVELRAAKRDSDCPKNKW